MLTDGKWLFQTAMDTEEMEVLREQIAQVEPDLVASKDELILIPGDSSLDSDEEIGEAAKFFLSGEGYMTVDSLPIPSSSSGEPHVSCREIATDRTAGDEGGTPFRTSKSTCDGIPSHPPTAEEIVLVSDDEDDAPTKEDEPVWVTGDQSICIISPPRVVHPAPSVRPQHSRNPVKRTATPAGGVALTQDQVLLFAEGQESDWHTIGDSTCADFMKRGAPKRKLSDMTPSDSPHLKKALLDAQAHLAVQKEGMAYKLPAWRTKNRGFSLHILHDGLLRHWSQAEKKCALTEAIGSIKDWSNRLRSRKLHLQGHSVVVVLKEFCKYRKSASTQE